MSEVISVVEMNAGEAGVVLRLQGGRGMINRLQNMGIRIGSKIKKLSQQFMRGPVVISYGNTQVAVGFGMAQRIMVGLESGQSKKGGYDEKNIING